MGFPDGNDSVKKQRANEIRPVAASRQMAIGAAQLGLFEIAGSTEPGHQTLSGSTVPVFIFFNLGKGFVDDIVVDAALSQFLRNPSGPPTFASQDCALLHGEAPIV